MKTIALVIPAGGGHHQTYERYYAKTLLELGYQVEAFTPQPDSLLAWIGTASPLSVSRLRVTRLSYARRYRVPGVLSIFFDKLAWVRFVGRMIQRAGVKPDLVFHTWLDNCLTPGLTAAITNLVFPYRWSGLYFHPWYLRQNLKYAALRRGPLTNHAALRSDRCPAVAVLDEGVAARLQQLSRKPVIIFPDIADDSRPDLDYTVAREIRAQARQRKVIGLLGVLSRRKGMVMLMEVARQTEPDKWFFVFAGELDQNSFEPAEQQRIAAFVKSKPDNCYFHLERLPDEPQFNAVVDTCDILFAVYQYFLSSSNLLTKAAIFEKPIIVSDAYCMGERVRQFGLGAAIDERSLPQCLAAIQQIGQALEQSGRLPGASFEVYRRRHSLDQLRAAFTTLLTAAQL